MKVQPTCVLSLLASAFGPVEVVGRALRSSPGSPHAAPLSTDGASGLGWQSNFTALLQRVVDVPHNMKGIMTEHAPADLDFVMYDTDGSMYNWLATPGEHFVQDAFHQVLKTNCRKDSSAADAWKDNAVLDIGSNTGFFGLMGLAYGCAVAFVDPQPKCLDLIRRSIAENHFDEAKFRIIGHPFGTDADRGKSLEVRPENRCEGRFPIANLEKGHGDAYGKQNASASGAASVPGAPVQVSFLPAAEAVRSLPLPQGAQILLAKVDTEGNELRILEGLKPLWSQGVSFRNMVVEVTPMWWKHTGYSLQDGANLFAELGRMGFKGMTVQTASFAALDTPEELSSHILNGKIYQEDLWLHHGA